MSKSNEPGCLVYLIAMCIAMIIFAIFPPSFLLSVPLIGVMLFKGAFSTTTKVIAKGTQQIIDGDDEDECTPRTRHSKVYPSDPTLEKQVKQVVASQLGIEEEGLTLDTELKTDLGADELDIIEIIMAVEEELDVSLSVEPDDVETIGDIVIYIKNVKQ